ncbi:MAG TPA: glycosyltransferase [Chitinophagales bacterium]|nr:glycosyltransferase [Chitinophagales bacterium]
MIFLTYLFIACCIYQIVYQLVLVSSIILKKKSQNLKISSEVSEIKSVSVIICAKNEAANLQKNLPFILEQNYPNFEVIVVDDGSDERLTMNDERLTIINLTKEEKIGFGKKYALQKGVEAAKNELVLLTDADCQPISRNWIAEMANCITDDKKIVLGISPYKTENTLLNALIEYETAQTMLQYLGFAILGNPYMCVGRNVLYDRNLLLSKTWSDKELSIASGDDDLAIQTLATNQNTTVCLSENSYTFSKAKNTWKSYFNQKTRHNESGKLYKIHHKLILICFIVSKILIYSTFFFILCLNIKLNVLLLSCVIAYPTITCMANMLLNITLKTPKKWYYSLILDLIYCFFLLYTGLMSLFIPNPKWK